MKNCKKCNTQMKDTAKFCPACGAPAEPPESPQGDPRSHHSRKKSAAPFIIICLVLILAMAGGTGFFVWKLKNGQKQETMAKGDDIWDSQTEKEPRKTAAKTRVEATTAAAAVAEATTAPETEAEIAAAAETGAKAEATTAAVTAAETAAPPVQTAPAEYLTVYVANCRDFITMRDSPSTTARELSKIPLGAAVSYVSTSTNGFDQIVYNGHIGYALDSYLSTSQPYVPPTSAVTALDTMYVVNCESSITLRSSDSTKAAEICQIPLGAPVSYVSAAGNGFCKIIYLGNTGYALSAYLSY